MQEYESLKDLLMDYDEVAYRPGKKGELIVSHPRMFTGSRENVLSVHKLSRNMKYIYCRILKKKNKK